MERKKELRGRERNRSRPNGKKEGEDGDQGGGQERSILKKTDQVVFADKAYL